MSAGAFAALLNVIGIGRLNLVAGLGIGALGDLTARFGTTAIAGRMAIVWLRTAGFLQRRSGFLAGLPIPSTPATRAFLPNVFPIPIPLGSFLQGFGYRDREELVRGWLSFFGELVFKDVPGVEGNAEVAIERLARGDFVGFGESMANAFSEDIGLSGVAAFFRGIAQIEEDAREAGIPALSAAPFIFGGAMAAVGFFDALIRNTGRFLGGLLGPPPGKPPAKPVPLKDLDPGLQNFLRDLDRRAVDPGTGLPTTETQVKRIIGTIRRLRGRLNAIRTLAGFIKGAEPSRKSLEKVRRLVKRLGR